jgi:chaperonin GroES
MFETFRPLGNNVLVKRVKNEEKTTGGLYIPDSAKEERAQTGTVIAVGPGRVDASGNRIQLSVKAGDVVYFGKYSGTEAGESHLIIKDEDILGVI